MPPIRHIVVFQLKPSAPPDAITTLSELRSSIPDLLHFGVYPVIPADRIPAGHMVNTLGLTHVVDAVLPSPEALRSYMEHPRHITTMQQLTPHMERLIGVDMGMSGVDVGEYVRLQRAPHVHHLTLIRLNEGADRSQLAPLVQQWGALPAVVPAVVWAQVGFAATAAAPLYPGWSDSCGGFHLVSDQVGVDLQSMAVYTQSEPHMRLAPQVMEITNVQQGGLVAVDWQL